MKKLFPSIQFKKDYKKYKNNPKKLKALSNILQLLTEEKEIPSLYKPHFLKGEYDGCFECRGKDSVTLMLLDVSH